MRGSKPAGFSGVGERAARSLDRVSRRRGPRRAAGASLEQRDLLDDVRRVREHSRGHDAGDSSSPASRSPFAACGAGAAACGAAGPPPAACRAFFSRSSFAMPDVVLVMVPGFGALMRSGGRERRSDQRVPQRCMPEPSYSMPQACVVKALLSDAALSVEGSSIVSAFRAAHRSLSIEILYSIDRVQG